jgi:hypothetical protein
MQAEKHVQEKSYEQEQTISLTESEDNTLITKLSVQRALSRLSEEEREPPCVRLPQRDAVGH